MSNLEIPESVNHIGGKAFSYNQLTKESLPDTVTSIGKNVFLGISLFRAYPKSDYISKSSKPTHKKVYYYIQDLYDEYDIKYNKGVYAGDKYEKEIFADAARFYGLNSSEVKKIYDESMLLGIY